MLGALVPLAVAATAWACGVLATLRVDKPVAAPGQQLQVTGANYSNDMTAFTPVQIRWNSRTGPQIGQATPVGGRIDTQVTVPTNAESGWYSLNGTQYSTSSGAPKSGTPGRTTLRVQGAAAAGGSAWGQAPGGGPVVRVDGGPGGPPLLPTLLGVGLSLALLASGLTLVSRSRTRKANQPLLGV